MSAGPNLQARLSMDDSQFNETLRRSVNTAEAAAKKMASGFGAAFAGLGSVISAGAIVGIGKSLLDTAGSIQDMSDALGMSTDQLQQWTFAFEQAGGSQEKFVAGMTKISAKLEDAKGGNEAAISSFERLGFSLDDIGRMRADQALLKIADSLKENGASANEVAAFGDIVGVKLQNSLIPALKDGSDAFLQLAASAKVISADTIKDLDSGFDRMTSTLKNWRNSAVGFIEDVAASIGEESISGSMGDVAERAKVYADQMQKLKEAQKQNEAPLQGPPMPPPSFFKAQENSDKDRKKSAEDLQKFQDDQEKAKTAQLQREGKILEQLAELQRKTALDRMTEEQRATELAKERLQLERLIANVQVNGLGNVGERVAAMRLRMAEIDAQTQDAPMQGPSMPSPDYFKFGSKLFGFKNFTGNTALGSVGIQGASGGLTSGFSEVERRNRIKEEAAAKNQNKDKSLADVVSAINQPAWTKE